jgi:hypothetical protein
MALGNSESGVEGQIFDRTFKVFLYDTNYLFRVFYFFRHKINRMSAG